MRPAWLHRLWLPLLLAAWGACLIAPLVLGQLPTIINGVPEPSSIVTPGGPQSPIIINGVRPSLGAPIAPPKPAPPPPPPPPPPPLPPPAPPQSTLPLEPVPAFEIEVTTPIEPIEPATFGAVIGLGPTFGTVIGLGPSPAPSWIGPEESPDDLLRFALTASYGRPRAAMPEDLPDDAPLVRFLPCTLAAQPQDREVQEPPAPPRVVTPARPAYRCFIAAPYRRVATQPRPAPQQPPLRVRIYEWMSTLTEPFRD